MTRDEAVEKIRRAIGERATCEMSVGLRLSAEAVQFDDILHVLGALGLIEFDEPKDWNHLQALAKALSDTVDSGSKQLTSARVNAALESYGFKIVRA